jgi:hypothetical protein
VGLIRRVFRFDLAPEISVLPCVPDCHNGGDWFVLRLLTCFAALLVLTLGLFFYPDAALAASPVAQEGPQQGVELSEKAAAKSEAAEAWDAVKNTTNPALLEAFIKRYGTTFFAEIAKARLGELKAAATKPSPANGANAIQTYPIHRDPDQQTPTNRFDQPALQKLADGLHQHAVLYEEDPSHPTGHQFAGSVVWRTELIKTDGKPDELAARADVDIPSRGLRMTMSLRRNLDPSLPASHVINLTFAVPADFNSGGVANVPGVLTKSNQQARGVPLAGLAVKVSDGFFLVGLASAALDRERNVKQLAEGAWFDIPIVYVNQRRAILAIGKGESGEQVFKTVLTTWGQYPSATQPAAAIPEPDSGNGARGR